MPLPQEIHLTLDDAVSFIQAELFTAEKALKGGDLETALDSHTRALGLALQLGPAPTELVIRAILRATLYLVEQPDITGRPCTPTALSALGPALAGLVGQIREADAIPKTAIMGAWSTFAADLGALIGQVGLALSIPAARRASMMDSAHARAALLDAATGERFALTSWLDSICG